ncbi:DUF6807 domain-containing protein [Pedobacter gandavensis]|uniref:Methane oxygenase PmoA n=1 Tax=Pedobacter gandavensis TaxID=2679963 RepID=A0ABR6ERC5_9SPHI|nr:PmoA family protein [Pedobacter gandavensis]MBB2147795.1 hypothetical protein [Pedobacter gandavensis]
MTKYLILAFCGLSLQSHAQTKSVSFQPQKKGKQLDVIVDGKFFTSFIYPDSLEKPILYPLQTATGLTLTRGFPLNTRDQERTDHPHHVGLWLNYESVNGLDFWNNSYNIPESKKSKYGWIRAVQLTGYKSGSKKGELSYTANWERQDRQVLLKEETTFTFSGNENNRTIDRVTRLTAQKDTVKFKDVKDGMIALRVTKELEMPSNQTAEFTDSQGNRTKVSASGNGANGDYLTSAGKKGNDAWGTRGNWCLLAGVKDQQQVSIAIIDHPKNPGYPTYWHARDYGLFAANPLGQQVFSNGKENLNLSLAPGESVTFRYRIFISSNEKPTADLLNEQAAQFSKTKN